MVENRVLVAGDEYYATLAAVRALRSAGYAPWLASTTDRSLAGLSRATAGVRRVPHPSDGAAGFVEAMRRFADEIAAVAVLPGTEPSLAALAGRDLGRPTGAPGVELVQRATDKELLARLAAAAGLRSPESIRFRLPGDLPEIGCPAVLKPARSTIRADGRTVDLPPAVRVNSPGALASAASELPPGDYLAQPALDGRLGALAGVAWEGAVMCVSQQVAERIHPPEAGASAFARTVPLDRDLVSGAEKLIGALAWSGLWELQYILAPDGPYLIDFNPRFYGSLALAIGAGLNLPAIWVDLLLGRTPRIGRYRPGVCFRAEGREARALAHAIRSGDVVGAARILTPRRRTVHAVFSLRDPRPLLSVAGPVRGSRTNVGTETRGSA